MNKLLVAAAIVAGSCTFAMAQGGQGGQGAQGGQDPSATPKTTQTPKTGTMREDKMPSKKVMMKKKTKKVKNPM
jgi:hypothetical protein